MNTKTLVVIMCVIAFSSCSTAYKTGQTPDDVYYSPGRATYIVSNANKYEDNYYEGQEILMSIRDPRWRDFNNDYSYSPYLYGYNYNYYYNPYYYPFPVYVLPYNPVNTTPRMTILSAYKNGYNNSNTSTLYKPVSKLVQSGYNNNNSSGSGFGNALRQVFSSSTGYSNYNTSSPVNNNNTNSNSNSGNRNYTPSSSSVSPSSSGEGISRPARGGRN